MPALNFTPERLLIDPQGRPYFLWDMEMTLETFKRSLKDPDPQIRAYFAGKLLRQAKPDDVFQFLSLSEISNLWPALKSYLGHSRAFWTWILREWGVIPRGEG